MAEAKPKTSGVILSTTSRLPDGVCVRIKEAVEAVMPPDVGVAVLSGLKVNVIGPASIAVDMVPGELVAEYTQAQILAELRALRRDLAAQHERLNAVGLRTVTE